ncbi:hypothetical protein BOTCAL_0083g00280 [Botryotinia calthae]|uniref:Uncharacterized protein n=1 Tax=Botryotinia calthae TaxID=38488 RepID=A0A4Y8D878_9HELO|nr:hypothetical protein BOTCAL_0083g00280 [Botryotinia calthae]
MDNDGMKAAELFDASIDLDYDNSQCIDYGLLVGFFTNIDSDNNYRFGEQYDEDPARVKIPMLSDWLNWNLLSSSVLQLKSLYLISEDKREASFHNTTTWEWIGKK